MVLLFNLKNQMIMPSTSEVGHAKNVANLQKLIEQVTVYTLYNLPVENLTVPNLTTLYSKASVKLTEVEDKRNANKNAIAQNVKKYVKSVYGAVSPEYTNVT